MDPQKFEAKEVRIEGAHGIEITTVHLDSRYSLQHSRYVDTTRSGYVVLFTLSPNANKLPTFRGRWDDQQKAVDIDMDGSWRARSAFKRTLSGYRGHHTKLITESPRRYAIDIRIPGMHVFHGEITLGTKIGVRLTDALHMKTGLTVSATVVRPSLLRRIGRAISKVL